MNYRGAGLNFFIESEDPASVAEHTRAVLAEVLPGIPLRQLGRCVRPGPQVYRRLQDVLTAGCGRV